MVLVALVSPQLVTPVNQGDHPASHKAAHTVLLGAQGQGGHRKEDFYVVAHWMDCNREKKGVLMSHETFNAPQVGKTHWTHHGTTRHRRTWDGADPTPQHKAHEERFYLSC